MISTFSTQKFHKRVIVPIIVIWLLCQSMVVCSMLLGSFFSSTVSLSNSNLFGFLSNEALVEQTHLVEGHLAENLGASEHGHHTQASASHTSYDYSESNASDGCCDEQNDAVSTVQYTFFAPLLLSFLIFWFGYQISKKSKKFNYFLEPRARFNYPRKHLVNCTFLN